MEPHVPPLERSHRIVVFYILVVLFVAIVPLLAFYANGFRYDFFSEEPMITVTGGMYISTQIPEAEIFINESPAQKSRFFRRATFVQGLSEDVHRVHVQGQDLQTWVKPLPVYSQMVTELFAFTLPETPQVRIVAQKLDQNGDVVIGESAFDLLTNFGDIHIRNTFSTTSTSVVPTTQSVEIIDEIEEGNKNDEFIQLSEAVEEIPFFLASQNVDTPPFRFATSSPEVDEGEEEMATTTVTNRSGISLVFNEEDDSLVALYTQGIRSIPHYFCIPDQPLDDIRVRYGEHVAKALEVDPLLSTSTIQERGSWNIELCRSEIVIDTKNETLFGFNFVPGFDNLVILHLESGVFVTEIDDRGWQNHQLLFPQNDGRLLVINNRIFLGFDDFFLELFLTLEEN